MRLRHKRTCGGLTACEMEAGRDPPYSMDWCPVLRIELCRVAVLSRRIPRLTERMTHITSDSETLQFVLYDRIATELAVKPEQVQRTVALLLDDATVPFI